ncbi:nuclear transport factor 2 family protein [Chitinophaga pinensis]|uniref:Ketosteroid isomerase-related protein-like protein n=1 Tax=Chitinophaga pinensis (strain ATCC 43595 / DSM 2588 / LMG 13176 / NBRC 15968 / NCIMB 11800 / UQM 2034) TaxID=485918 RepID=A0A979G6T9_CHIPD|nr:nuclear transport factor 2 family protein [Chitinophaga pinensis]ACU61810.1 ketosteroid isomerase-related protein-like protein [Chitinophaga pinensis DSM 2588]
MINKEIVRKGFERWTRSEGSFFDLLAANVVWTITGNSPVSKTYTSKQAFIAEVIDPLNERFSKKITPELKGIFAEDDMVIALWHGTAVAKDGRPYDNMYSWYMKMEQGKIIEVVAFFDTIEFTDIWNRIDITAVK